MKKIYAILLAIFLLTGVCPIPLYAAETVTASANTEDDAGISDLTDGEYAIDVHHDWRKRQSNDPKSRPCSLSMMESPMLPSPGAVPIMTI